MGKDSKYMDVYRDIKASILAEKFPRGSFLPTERELMERYNASRTTVRHAVLMLREDGLVDVRQGRGTQIMLGERSSQNSFELFHNVTGVSNSFLEEGEQRVAAQGGVICIVPADKETAQALEIEEGDMVYRLERLFLLNGRPFTYHVNFLRRELIPEFDKYSGRINELSNLYRFLDENYGIKFSSGKETISAISAGLFDARILDVDIGSPLLVFKRTALCGAGTMEYARLLTCPESIEITVSMAGPPTYYH